jgi:excisionase family DNA binding protein
MNSRYFGSAQAQSQILTLPEVAQLLRCSKAHLSNLLNGRVPGARPLPHVSVGRRKLIRRESLEHWLHDTETAKQW